MKVIPLTALRNKIVHAVAGIGNPDRFFNDLRKEGLTIVSHAFPDHYSYQFSDIDIGHISDTLIIMTEKDAIKCQSFADERHWFLPITAEIEQSFLLSLSHDLNSILLK